METKHIKAREPAIIEPSRELPVSGTYDVVVVGGGIAKTVEK